MINLKTTLTAEKVIKKALEEKGKYTKEIQIQTDNMILTRLEITENSRIYWGRSFYDSESFILPTNESNYRRVEEWEEYPYRQVFVDYTHKRILTFCEGDITLQIYNNQKSFLEALKSCKECYEIEEV